MGNSGARKLFFQGENVETHYKSLYNIPIVTIDKEEVVLTELQGKVSLVVNTASNSEEDRKHLSDIRKIHDSGLQTPILLFPTNTFKNEPNSYADIKATYNSLITSPRVFQKVEVNGAYIHPVYKYLKRYTPQLYNSQLCQGKPLSHDFCKFIVNQEGKPVKFFTKDVPIEQIIADLRQMSNQ